MMTKPLKNFRGAQPGRTEELVDPIDPKLPDRNFIHSPGLRASLWSSLISSVEPTKLRTVVTEDLV